VIDGYNHHAPGTFPVGADPHAIVVDSERANVYVADYGQHPVTTLDLSSIHH
jgi:DNA-binding beta-propeller fold protein YncE